MDFHSLGVKFGTFFLLATVPVAVLLLVQNGAATNVVHNQVAESEHQVLVLHRDGLDTALDAVDQYLVNLLNDDPSVPTLEEGAGEAYSLAKIQLYNKLSSAAQTVSGLGGYVAALPRKGESILAFNPLVPVLSLIDRQSFVAALTTTLGQETGSWNLAVFGTHHLAVRTLRSGNLVLGAWFDVDVLLKSMPAHFGGDRTFLVDEHGRLYPPQPVVDANRIDLSASDQSFRISGQPVPHLVLSQQSSKGAFRLTTVIPDERLLQSLPLVRTVNLLVALGMGGLLLGFYLLLSRNVLRPVNLLSRALEQLEAGDFETRVISSRTSRELDRVTDTFNSMASKIRDLRINVYEEQLHSQQAELMYLRLQINPHFFLNSLNILHQMAQVKNFELIQELTRELSKYFQFLFRSSSDFVPLTEEWSHVRTYVRIQEMRFPGRVRCRYQNPDPLPALPVPPLLLQTFVENAMKYAMDDQGVLDLSLSMEREEVTGTALLSVIDSGPGFDDETLDRLNQPQGVQLSTEHVGISNLKRRLGLLYHNRAQITFSNRLGARGAVVQIRIPMPADWS